MPMKRGGGYSLESNGSRSQSKDDRSSSNTTGELRETIQYKSHKPDGSGEEEGQADVRIEEAAGDSIEDPNIDSNSTTKARRDVHQTEREEGSVRILWIIGGYGSLGSDEGQEQEHEGSAELAKDDGEDVPNTGRDGMTTFASLVHAIAAYVENASEIHVEDV